MWIQERAILVGRLQPYSKAYKNNDYTTKYLLFICQKEKRSFNWNLVQSVAKCASGEHAEEYNHSHWVFSHPVSSWNWPTVLHIVSGRKDCKTDSQGLKTAHGHPGTWSWILSIGLLGDGKSFFSSANVYPQLNVLPFLSGFSASAKMSIQNSIDRTAWHVFVLLCFEISCLKWDKNDTDSNCLVSCKYCKYSGGWSEIRLTFLRSGGDKRWKQTLCNNLWRRDQVRLMRGQT